MRVASTVSTSVTLHSSSSPPTPPPYLHLASPPVRSRADLETERDRRCHRPSPRPPPPMKTTPPPPAAAAGEAAETLVALAAAKEEEKVKRARKRSRYLSPPYTNADADDITPEQAKQDKEEEASLLLRLQEANVATADLLSALLQSAASASASPPSPNVDAGVLLRFFALYRISLLAKAVSHQGPMDDDDAGHMVLLNTCHAMAVAAKKQDEDIGYASARHIGRPVNAGAASAAALQAGRKRKKDPSTDSPVRSTSSGVANSAPKMKKTRKRHEKYFGNPAALVLDFTKDAIDLPSKEELLSAFRRFGFVIESETEITKDPHRARVVFGSRAIAETAYSCAQTLGRFGPPFTVPWLQYLPPIKLNAPWSPPPAPKLPLTDIRKNLEKMIWSLTRPASFSNDRAHNLVGEMQGLLAKVDKVLSAGPSATTGHHH